MESTQEENSKVFTMLNYFTVVRDAVTSGGGTLLGFDDRARTSFKEDYDVNSINSDDGNESEDGEEDGEEDDDEEDDEEGKKRKNNNPGSLPNKKQVDVVNVGSILPVLQKLEKVTPFAIGGQQTIAKTNFQVYMRNESDKDNLSPVKCADSDKRFDSLGKPNSLNVETVLKYCEVSPFGDLARQETRIDPSVRLAMECKAERMSIAVPRDSWGSSFTSSIQSAIENDLLKNTYKNVQLELNKLNIYSKDGHFKPHTDTPTHDPSKFLGSVVVCLPSAHEGGELVVRHAGQETVFDFSTESNNTDIIQFAAFYGDCEHEVRPVTAGHRVTLTYSILGTVNPSVSHRYYAHYSPNNDSVKVTAKGGPYESIPLILERLYDELKAQCGATKHLGVFLSHAYTNSALVASNLKGPDKLLYDMLVEKNVPVSLVPVVSKEKWERYEGDYADCNEDDGIPDFPVTLIPGFDDLRLPEHKTIRSGIPFISGWPISGVCVRNEESHGGHTGNECDPHSVDKLYIKGAMIIGPVV